VLLSRDAKFHWVARLLSTSATGRLAGLSAWLSLQRAQYHGFDRLYLGLEVHGTQVHRPYLATIMPGG
jgi:hypothetical protein